MSQCRRQDWYIIPIKCPFNSVTSLRRESFINPLPLRVVAILIDSWSIFKRVDVGLSEIISLSFHLTEELVANMSFAYYQRSKTKELWRAAELSGWSICLCHATLCLRNDLESEWKSWCGFYEDQNKQMEKNPTRLLEVIAPFFMIPEH